MTGIDAVAVVVPVHDEEELLGDALAALRAAIDHLHSRHPAVAVEACVVLDSCRDRSGAVAASAGFPTVEIEARNVGRARSAGLTWALDRLAHVPDADVWTAATDGDSLVPAHWLTTQLALAGAGADVVVGTVRPDFAELDAERTAAWWARYTPGVANGHVHGANLGVRASTLRSVGGFAPLPEHEDVALVAEIARTGARIVASDDAWVRTSGRLTGRTPGGYARYLRDDLVR